MNRSVTLRVPDPAASGYGMSVAIEVTRASNDCEIVYIDSGTADSLSWPTSHIPELIAALQYVAGGTDANKEAE